MGHTTRCLPIIKAFINHGALVSVACNDTQARIIQPEFPGITILPLKGYNFRYAASGVLNSLITIFQVPKILISIKRENRWLAAVLQKQQYDIIISDNRYGFQHHSIHCVFITHQLSIQVPISRWAEKIIQKWNYYFINQFDECWVPDLESHPNLGGELSHPKKYPAIPVKYVGTLSRFENSNHPPGNGIDFLVLLSGPEPQRTILEKLIVSQLKGINQSAVVLRGIPGDEAMLKKVNDVSFFNHLPTAELNKLMIDSKFIISRSGFSTIMDIMKLGKKSILIPTPGQTEQEYLAEYIRAKNWCLCFAQRDFSLQAALQQAVIFKYSIVPAFQESHLDKIVQEIMDVIGKRSADHGK